MAPIVIDSDGENELDDLSIGHEEDDTWATRGHSEHAPDDRTQSTGSTGMYNTYI